MNGSDDTPVGKLKNLGPVNMGWFLEVDIRTRGDLVRLGAVAAYRTVAMRQERASHNLLYALQAALDDVHWTALPAETKARLRREVEEMGQ